MNSQHAFTIYNAGAGAGKTYTLVKAYLLTLLTGEFKDSYRNILAITFTNKAVAEMKTRVLENLVAISSPQTPSKYLPLLQDLVTETGITESELKLKASRILKSILHNYAAFDIVTIDTFTHRVIRTFAHDLGIPMNFEIEMDTESLIEEAVDSVIAKIGVDDKLTKIIIDFAFTKLEEDKSWDISIELNKVAKLLFSENDRAHLNSLSNKTIRDFETLKKILYEKIKTSKTAVISKSQQLLQLILTKGIAYDDFTRSSIPNHFQKLEKGEIVNDYQKTKWKQEIETTSFYNKTLNSDKKDSIDTIRPEIEKVFTSTRQQLSEINFYENIIKNLTPLSILNAINKELIQIKKEKRILLISEFNSIISDAIKDQPAPFIYERIGERYKDYFIDEFQDTSELQWNNLIPLIDNAISSETLSGKRGSVTIVGDAKQAIYRWRGGKAEQFINLSIDQNPFSIQEKQVLNLPKNYRSHEEIVNFNNTFFTFLSNDFSNEKHQNLYVQGNKQEVNAKPNGYVNISFVEAKNADEENEVYPERVYQIILELKEKGYGLNEICILTRKQKEGSAIADFLTEKGLPIISSETLLIQNDPSVVFIVDLLTWFIQPENLVAKTNMLQFIADRWQVQEKHLFLQNSVFGSRKAFISEIKNIGIDFNFNHLSVKPLYDGVEYIIHCFRLADSAPAYLQFFLDIVFSYTQKHTEGIFGFLSYWTHKKEKLSIIAPDGEEAIRIMTIHKSKGLEFPCVIYPYANIDIYKEIEPKTWLSVEKETFNNFEEVFINYNKDISEYSDSAQEIVSNRKAQQELDMLNLLYVALTRAEEQLYVVSKLELNTKGESNPNKYSGKLISYLKHIGKWDIEQHEYNFGDSSKPESLSINLQNKAKNIKIKQFDASIKNQKTHIVTNSGKLWDTSQKDAIEKGNLLHDLMADIYTRSDVIEVVESAYEKGAILGVEKEKLNSELKRIIDHPELSLYFSEENIVLNEREIMAYGKSYRPDRIIINTSNHATIIDYKTGAHQTSHANQINTYGTLLQDLGYVIKHKILIYLNENISLKYI